MFSSSFLLRVASNNSKRLTSQSLFVIMSKSLTNTNCMTFSTANNEPKQQKKDTKQEKPMQGSASTSQSAQSKQPSSAETAQPPPPQSPPSRIFSFLKSAWTQTFPSEEDQIIQKHQATKNIKRYTKEELQQMQQEIPQYQRKAVVLTDEAAKVEAGTADSSAKKRSFIPEALREKLASTETYRNYTQFRQNLKQYVSTRDGAVSNAGSFVYSAVAEQSSIARATQQMRKYQPGFNPFQFEQEANYVFMDAFKSWMAGDMERVEKLTSGQALGFFEGYVKLLKTQV